MKPPIVFSLGGSVLVPKEVDTAFIKKFVGFVRRIAKSRRVYIVCGGGHTARHYVHSARKIGIRRVESLHWIGVRSCQLNAAMLGAAFGLPGRLLTDRENLAAAKGRIIVVAPSVPGATSDYGSVLAARAVGAAVVFNVTNVAGVFSANPQTVRTAKLLPVLSWGEFARSFGSVSRPSMHVPFDPIASRLAARSRIKVVVLSSDLRNLHHAIAGFSFRGTTIGPS